MVQEQSLNCWITPKTIPVIFQSTALSSTRMHTMHCDSIQLLDVSNHNAPHRPADAGDAINQRQLLYGALLLAF